MKISVVIPVFREEGIAALLDDLLTRQDAYDTEFIIVDGAPERDTLDRITDPRVICLTSPAGRGAQQNRGAEAASGEILLFLHADTLLPDHAFTLIRSRIVIFSIQLFDTIYVQHSNSNITLPHRSCYCPTDRRFTSRRRHVDHHRHRLRLCHSCRYTA